jgi:hypothetical protein
MVARILYICLFLINFNLVCQNEEWKKEDIYILFDSTGSNRKMTHKEYKGDPGIYFQLGEDESEWMNLFYSYSVKSDTLPKSSISNYTFLNKEQIENKEFDFYKKIIGGYPPVRNKNGMFNTYLIESLDDNIVVYPAVWPWQGGID